MALAARVIASHYAEAAPERRLALLPHCAVRLPRDAATLRDLAAGEPFAMLDDSLGWAWGYAGAERHVGYVRSDALAAH